MKWRWAGLAARIAFTAIIAGCSSEHPQSQAEHEAVYRISQMLTAYEWEHPKLWVTNLEQVFTALKRDYPYYWDEEFKRFGVDAGFTNSF
jgi:hypothetical protein